MTPQKHVYLAAIIRRAAQIEADLTADIPTALQIVLVKARGAAIEACDKLIYCDPANAGVVTSLQNEVRIFFDLVEFSKATLSEAADAEAEIHQTMSEEEQQAVSDLILRPNSDNDE